MQLYFWNELIIESPEAQWEDSASNIPSSSDEVLEDSDIGQNPARTMAILSFFLDTTRGAPFSFTLYGKEPYTKEDATYVRPIFEKLLHHSVQWQNVTMQLRQPEFQALRNIKGRLPMLRTLSCMVQGFNVVVYNKPGGPFFSNLCTVFEDAPLLTNIELASLTFRFNWTSLTSIHLHSFDGEGVISALRQTINLETFTVDEVLYNDQVNAEGTEIIRLPRLRYLSIHGVLLLTFLEAPALKELKIKFEDESGPDMEEALEESELASRTIAFFLRSRCELSKFSSESLESPALTDILTHMPDIHELSLEVTHLPGISGVFEWLGGSELPLRNLKVLSIFSFFEDNELKPVQEMMARRNPMVGTLGAGPKELHMDLNGLPRSETTVLKSLESLCEDRGIRFAFDTWEEGMFTVTETGVYLSKSSW